MKRQNTVYTDEILVEFYGDLSDTVRQLGWLYRGYHKTYPKKDDGWWSSTYAYEEYLSIVDRLNQLAPEGYYFGGHTLEPQCLGYWPIS